MTSHWYTLVQGSVALESSMHPNSRCIEAVHSMFVSGETCN